MPSHAYYGEQNEGRRGDGALHIGDVMLPSYIFFGDRAIEVRLEDRTAWTANVSGASHTLGIIKISPSLSAEAQKAHLFLKIMDFVYWHTESEFSPKKKYLITTLIYTVLRDNPWLLGQFEMASVQSVRILGRRFTVSFKEKHDPYKGQVLSSSFEIDLRKEECFRDAKTSFVHEIIHNVLNVVEWPDDDDDYEGDTSRLTNALMFLMGQNDLSWIGSEDETDNAIE